MTEAKKLSPRLAQLLSFLKPCRCLADIGSDHGYLICQAVLEGKAASGIAVELSSDPYQRTILSVVEAFLLDEVSVRMGNGLEPLQEGEADAVCIAGMGGKTIAEILMCGRDKLGAVRQLILQPNVDADRVRLCLNGLGFVAQDEALVSDSGFIYQIISAVPGESGSTPSLTDYLLLAYGGHNLDRGGELIAELISRDASHLETVAAQLLLSSYPSAIQKRDDVLARVGELRAYLAKNTR